MFEELRSILSEEMSIEPEIITRDAELVNDLKFNSLELADLVVLCEERFGMEFSEADLPTLSTVGDVVDCIEKATNDN